MRRTISGMIGTGSLAHNRRDFIVENVDPDRVHLNICYQNENLKEVYKELFDDSVERYNVGKRKDRQITNYYEKIRQGKQEKLFHEVIFQIGNREDMAVGTTEGDLAVKVLDEYVKNFQQRNPTLHVFSCYLHQDEATPHLHIDFGVPEKVRWRTSNVRKIKQRTEEWRDETMKKHIYEESNRLSYTMHGDYYLPDLVVNEEEPTYGKYGMLRKQFLKVHRPARYQYLLMTGELTAHLNRVDQEAREQVKIMLKQMAEKQGVTEQLKMQDQMKWVGLMNGIKACAEEIVLKERVYM